MKTLKSVLAIATLLSIAFTSCSKKSSTPTDPNAPNPNDAVVNYQVQAINQSSGIVQWSTGTALGKQVAFKGNSSSRVERYIPIYNDISISSATSYLNKVEVPSGTYTDAEFNVQLTPSRNPSLQLKGTYNNGTESIPVTLNFDQFVELATKVPTITFEGGKTYTATVKLDLASLMSVISATQLSAATRNDTGEIFINFQQNVSIYNSLLNNINNVMQHTVEIR